MGGADNRSKSKFIVALFEVHHNHNMIEPPSRERGVQRGYKTNKKMEAER